MYRDGNYLKRVIILTIISVLLLTSFTFAEVSNTLDQEMNSLKSMISYIEENYANEVTREELMEAIYHGLFDALDPHSSYYDQEELDDFNLDNTGTFGGIGLTVGIREDKITVIAPIDDTPGERAGIKAGDVIISVDDIDISDYSLERAVNLMRGEPQTEVKLEINRNGQVLNFTIIRDIIEINPVEYEVLPDKIGYIKIKQFNDNSSKNVYNALEEFAYHGVKGVILDLRNNPGGLLSEAVSVAEPFVPKGPIVHIDRKNQAMEAYEAYFDRIGFPLVVLVNGGSASASEIVAGAIQDTQSGTIVGTQTYGKGTIQTVKPMANGGGIKLTIAEYLTPNGRRIDGVGIQPDIIVENIENINKEDIKHFVPMIEDEKPILGSKGLNVYGAQQRLQFMGYHVEVTGIMDDKTLQAIKLFQQNTDLNPDGILDYTTKDKLNEEVINIYNNGTKDLQLEKAIELIRG